jgi:hypothetical protein
MLYGNPTVRYVDVSMSGGRGWEFLKEQMRMKLKLEFQKV